MTLSTVIVVEKPIDPKELFFWVNKNLLRTSTPVFTEKKDSICNSPGQGLDALFLLYHNNGERLEGRGYFDESDFDPEDYFSEEDRISDRDRAEESQRLHNDGYVYLDFDTAYGYSGPDGLGCNELHAFFIISLVKHLAETGNSLHWKDEYSGEWHSGTEGLKEFVDSNEGVYDWFKDVAQALQMEQSKSLFGTSAPGTVSKNTLPEV